MALLSLGLVLSIPLTAAWQIGPDFSNNFGRPGADATFDYVVVGAGPAGITLATRLAEHENVTVALVEAGGFYEVEASNLTVVPAYYADSIGGPLVDWNFKTTPQPQLKDQRAPYTRGKTLGGSSALNAMLYQRGTIQSHQQWADAVDDQSYSWEAFLPYFQKSVNYTSPNTHLRAANASVPRPSSEAYQPDGGPLHVTHSNWATPWASWAQKGFREIGIPDIDGFDSGNLLGSQYCPCTIRPEDQTRATSESTFLQKAMQSDRTNLKVFTHTLAKQVLFDGNKTATGVVVETGGFNYTLSASKEVILSAGAFQSPQLLIVSGVGPEETLREHDIPVVSARPGVGQNMWDHILFSVVYEANLSSTAILKDQTVAAGYEAEYLANATGILASQNADYLGWEKLPAENRQNLSPTALADLAEFPPDWPEIEYVVGSYSISPTLSLPKNYVSVFAALITPLSRGNVSIASSSMKDAPLIDVGWLTNSTDLEVLVQSLKRTRALFESSAIRPVLVGEEVLPGKDVVTDAQIAEYIRSVITTVYHASCTCKMGKASDPMAVVDSKARVFGVQGLRVVDASAFPLLVPGHPQSTIYALAEKIADDIMRKV